MTAPTYKLARIQRTSTASQVADAVAQLILSGELPPGQRLLESEFAASVGVSRNTFREALRLLEHDGLISHEPHRGAVVTAISPSDVRDLYEIRRVVERAALDAIQRQGGKTHVEALRSRWTALQQAAEVSEIAEADMAFHKRLVGCLESVRWDEFFRTLQSELRLGLALLDRADADVQLEEHGRIVEALSEMDFDTAAAVLDTHLCRARDRLAAMVVRT